ncbi:uncharacterized protein V1513DRAFT_466690 [Lipomyces chichibuensis]|uniref:uncharacterized protein n=1 Tax=Lipomyces chichibuensis TaxID=1546026 RepID=UPI003343DAF9
MKHAICFNCKFALQPRPDPLSGTFSVFPALYYNKFLFWAVIGGFLGTFPVIYIPVVNKDVFKHLGLSWEWGVVAGACIIYVVVVESWKAVKRRTGLWSGKLTLTPEVLHAIEHGATAGSVSDISTLSSSPSLSDGGYIVGVGSEEVPKLADQNKENIELVNVRTRQLPKK